MRRRQDTPRRARALANAGLIAAMALGSGAASVAHAQIQPVSLERAVVAASPRATPRERTAVRVLVEEIEKRTGIRLPVVDDPGDGADPSISVGRVGAMPQGTPAALLSRLDVPGREGFQLAVSPASGPARVAVAGADERGVLFGVGRLLRELTMERGRLEAPAGWAVSSTPQAGLRGHQLGYRPKANSYDGWSVSTWDQYIRDLAVFGANAIELIPPRSDDDASSPHFTLPQMEMMVEMSRIADAYGLDVWIWYPALDASYAGAGAIDRAVREWAEVFARLPRVNAVMVPGGDPGDTRPRDLFPLLERQAANLRRHHPDAALWLSPQGFGAEWMEEFYGLVEREPAWLGGIVFGPQVRDPLPVLRRRVPARYPIRHYPDITHSLRSQYPVPDWDVAHALTAGREPINPRPLGETAIYRALDRDTIGFITYSEGCNDDVNKAVWSALGWNRDADARETLRQYARYFVGPRDSVRFADGLLALERNWRGPLAANDGVEATLAAFEDMGRDRTPDEQGNWRFEMALYRAYYDACVRRRLLLARAREAAALRALAGAPADGSAAALDRAERELGRDADDSGTRALRARIEELARGLFDHVRMQLSVAKYGAIGVERGATLDTLDTPLDDREWLAARFSRIRAMDREDARLAAISEIVHWTDPGAGGFYDDLGDPEREPHLRRAPGVPGDPSRFERGATGFGSGRAWRRSWITHAESFYDDPLELAYDGLDPGARYVVRVVYAGDLDENTPLRLVANGTIEVHGWRQKPAVPERQEFAVPLEATRAGRLTLTWQPRQGAGGAGRGTQVAEVWLVKAASE